MSVEEAIKTSLLNTQEKFLEKSKYFYSRHRSTFEQAVYFPASRFQQLNIHFFWLI